MVMMTMMMTMGLVMTMMSMMIMMGLVMGMMAWFAEFSH